MENITMLYVDIYGFIRTLTVKFHFGQLFCENDIEGKNKG